SPDNLTNTRIKVVEGKKYISRYGKIPWQIQAGYHTLNIELSNNKNYQAMIISAPVKAYPVPDEEKSSWGVFLPLYALHSEHSLGSGDFGDLAQLTKWCGGIGGNIVGTLPLLSTSYEKKSNISPYTPWSRFFWNEIFLDINKIPELETSLLAKEILISEAFQDEIKYYRSRDQVDYQGIAKLKHRILNELCHEFYSRPSTRFDEYSRYIEDNPELERYAIFRATQEKLGDRWQSWPEAVRRVRIENSGYSESNKRYHQYVQWLATLQMRELLDDCKQSGVRLYLDLPAGVNQDGFDVWNNGSTFIKELSAGAPPDAVFQQGQYWNFPPFHPDNLRNSHYHYIINSLRHILKNTGIIRIDHFMGVHRIFCIPKDTDASNGVYIHYKPDELYAILTLESINSKTVVVGEDLGMVPDYVRTCMNRHGIYHTSVLHYELAMDPKNVLEKIPRKSIVSINTHDMAPFAAFWKESDIEEKKKVGLIDEKSAIREHQLRKEAKQELINLLKEKGLLTEETKDDLQITLRAVIAMLSESKAEMFLLNLEDLWLETHFQNIPSSESYPNWRNKAQYSIEILKEMPEVIELLNLINAIRRKKSESVIISSEEPVTKPEVLYDYMVLTLLSGLQMLNRCRLLEILMIGTRENTTSNQGNNPESGMVS
ncbi:MAG: 4-alpha-glucanotransferase, partial [Chloroflexi bacterium]|nr:4-alpha-glucanotransferase [Chloroflexota bacterium]